MDNIITVRCTFSRTPHHHVLNKIEVVVSLHDIVFSDGTHGAVNVTVSHQRGRTVVNKEDLAFIALPASCNKQYHIQMTASAKVRLVVVAKARTEPVLADFYGGDRLSKDATLLVVDFAGNKVSKIEDNTTGLGIRYVVESANSSTVSMIGMRSCSENTTLLYIGIMPTVYDVKLCERCMAHSHGPCGFCSGKGDDGVGDRVHVKVTVVRYEADCLFWNEWESIWKSDGCEVSAHDISRSCYALLCEYAYVHAFIHDCMSVACVDCLERCSKTPNNRILCCLGHSPIHDCARPLGTHVRPCTNMMAHIQSCTRINPHKPIHTRTHTHAHTHTRTQIHTYNTFCNRFSFDIYIIEIN